MGGAPPREGKSPGNEVGVACGMCVNKMADATLSSEDEEIENPIETAVSRGASLWSMKRLRFPESGQYNVNTKLVESIGILKQLLLILGMLS